MDKSFYLSNEVRIGKDFHCSTPHYYSSLSNAFRNYFSTYLDIKDKLTFLGEFKLQRKYLSFNYLIPYEKVVSIIIDFHRFFELLIKDILYRYNPFLSVKIDNSAKDYYEFIINGKINESYRTIEFSEAKKRFNILMDRINESSEDYKLKKFKFLTASDSGLDILSWWRNRITHNGNNLPNILSLDYLISQKIIPLLVKVIEVESEITGINYTPYYFTTSTGLNLIQRISKIELTKKDLDLTKYEVDYKKMNKYIELQLLKGLGRAAINYSKGAQLDKYKEYHKKYEWNYQLIDLQQNRPELHKTNNCLGCGNRSLFTFKEVIDDFFSNEKVDLTWCQCFICDYGVSNKIGNPKDYNLTDIDLFE